MSDEPTLAEQFFDIADQMAPMREWAKGYRAALEADDWSPRVAERIAAEALIEMTAAAFRGGAK